MNTSLDMETPATREFCFLEKQGFSRSEQCPTQITYLSSVVRLDILFDTNRSFELDVTICLDAHLLSRPSEPSFNLGEILRAAAAPEAARFRCVQITTQSSLELFLSEMAKLVRKYGGKLLEADMAEFHRLAQRREDECQKYADETNLNRARNASADAWKKRDYVAVVKALSSVAAELLSESDKKRLIIAKHRSL